MTTDAAPQAPPLSSRIQELLPLLQDVVCAYEPPPDWQDVVETVDEYHQRMDYGVMKTAYELLNEALERLTTDTPCDTPPERLTTP